MEEWQAIMVGLQHAGHALDQARHHLQSVEGECVELRDDELLALVRDVSSEAGVLRERLYQALAGGGFDG